MAAAAGHCGARHPRKGKSDWPREPERWPRTSRTPCTAQGRKAHEADIRNFGLLPASPLPPCPMTCQAPLRDCDEVLGEGRYGGDTIQLAPPFISTSAEIDRLVSALGDALQTETGQLPSDLIGWRACWISAGGIFLRGTPCQPRQSERHHHRPPDRRQARCRHRAHQPVFNPLATGQSTTSVALASKRPRWRRPLPPPRAPSRLAQHAAAESAPRVMSKLKVLLGRKRRRRSPPDHRRARQGAGRCARRAAARY